MEQFTDWLGGFWTWMVGQSIEGYELAASFFTALSRNEQYAIVTASVLLALLVTLSLRERGAVLRILCFLACLLLFLAVGTGVTYLVLDLMDPDSVIRHPVPRMG